MVIVMHIVLGFFLEIVCEEYSYKKKEAGFQVVIAVSMKSIHSLMELRPS
jgi:hypothetical protein